MGDLDKMGMSQDYTRILKLVEPGVTAVNFKFVPEVAWHEGMAPREIYEKHKGDELRAALIEYYGLENFDKGWKETVLGLTLDGVERLRDPNNQNIDLELRWLTNIDIEQALEKGGIIYPLASQGIMIPTTEDCLVMARRSGRNPLNPMRMRRFATTFYGPTPAERANDSDTSLTGAAVRALAEEISQNLTALRVVPAGIYEPGSVPFPGPRGIEFVSFMYVNATAPELVEIISDNARVYNEAFNGSTSNDENVAHNEGVAALVARGMAKDGWEHDSPLIIPLDPAEMDRFREEQALVTLEKGYDRIHTLSDDVILKRGAGGLCTISDGVLKTGAERIRKYGMP